MGKREQVSRCLKGGVTIVFLLGCAHCQECCHVVTACCVVLEKRNACVRSLLSTRQASLKKSRACVRSLSMGRATKYMLVHRFVLMKRLYLYL